MQNTNQNKTPFDVAFEKNIKLRPCSYDPSQNYDTEINDQGKTRKFLRVSYKLLWFYTYCTEQNLVGHIISDDVTLSQFGDISMVTVKAAVQINGTTVATGVAAQSFANADTKTMDMVVQTASSLAVSRALTNAGFGVISGFDEEISGGTTAPANAPLPYTIGDTPAEPDAQVNPGNQKPQNTAAPVAAPVEPEDPLAVHKAVVWSIPGRDKGKTMGELLATAPGKIEWVAKSWNGTGPMKTAAMALLNEALRLQGKPVPQSA